MKKALQLFFTGPVYFPSDINFSLVIRYYPLQLNRKLTKSEDLLSYRE